MFDSALCSPETFADIRIVLRDKLSRTTASPHSKQIKPNRLTTEFGLLTTKALVVFRILKGCAGILLIGDVVNRAERSFSKS